MPSNGSPNNPAFYPVGLNLSQQPVLVIGGGPVATRKIRRLLATGCRLTLISPDLCPELADRLAQHPEINYLKRLYTASDVETVRPVLVFACTNHPAINAGIVADAQAQHILANSATEGIKHSQFIVPSVITFDSLQIALFSGGASPLLLRRLRETFESQLGEWVGPYLTLLGNIRSHLKTHLPNASQRNALLETLLADETLLQAVQADAANLAVLQQDWLEKNLF